MARILVIGDLLLDHYKFYENVRNDPATPDIPVVKLVNEIKVDGGAGYLVRNLKELVDIDVIYFHGSVPTKIRNYMDGKYTFREDINDEILHSPPLIDEFVDEIKDNDYVVISDYHKGTIKYSDIKRILNKCNETNITFIDTNHVQPEHEGVDWLKINYETAKKCVNKNGKNIAKVISKKNNSNVIITKGEDGFIAYFKELEQLIYFTKDPNNNFVDAIGAGDTFLAGFVSYLARHMFQFQTHQYTGELSALVYADIVAHLSTSQLGTLDVVTAEVADEEYKNAKTSIEEIEDTIYGHRTINDD